MPGDQASVCPIHGKNKKKNALFNSQRRKNKARDWYSQHDKDYDVVRSRARGIDCNRPVGVKTLQPGKKLEQWVRTDGKPGIEFTEPGTPPGKLGIEMDPNTGLPVGRVLQKFEVTKPIKVLRSWTAEFPEKIVKLVGGPGGGPQITMPPGWQNSVKVIG